LVILITQYSVSQLKFHFSIPEFAEIIRDLIGGNSVIEQYPAVEDDPQRRKPDITRARTILNWEPRVPLRDGLQKTIEYFRSELEVAQSTDKKNSV
jgi:nucleoside-diphosphate-sugar epimerase